MTRRKFHTLYLHIGLEKTGTTSIQEFLHVNQTALSQRGIFLPKSLGKKNHKRLAAAALDQASRDIAVRSTNRGHSRTEVSDYWDRLKTKLFEEIDASDAEDAIITSEDLSRLFKPEEVARVIDLLEPLCDTLKVIVFVRRQDLLATSRYYSLVLGGNARAKVIPTGPNDRPQYYEYAQNIGHWINAVGEDNTLLATFPENTRKHTFNSVEAFCALVGLTASDFETTAPKHVSFDAVNQIILQSYNQLAIDKAHSSNEALMSALENYNDKSLKFTNSAMEAKAFYDRYHTDNLRLFERLNAQDQMFSMDFSMYPEKNMKSQFQQMAIQRLLHITKLDHGTYPPATPSEL